MKLIFLHGLGQSADSWQEVQELLVDYPSEALELFPSGVATYQEAKERIYQYLSKETEPFVLIGLSLGLCSGTRTFQLRFTKSSGLGFVRLSIESGGQYPFLHSVADF